jgi:hypothetical protein
MTGKLGWIERELEEFDYDSESEIENGDWVLQSGDGYFVQELSYGNFAKGKYENSNANTTTTESWTNLTGTSQRTDYEVENAEWMVDDESETIVDLLEYLYNDESATVPNNYRTITVDEQTYNDFESYFANANTNNTSATNSVSNTASTDDDKIIKAIELALAPALPVASIKVRNMVYDVISRYEMQISINGSVATVVINAVRYRKQFSVNDLIPVQSVREVERIGSFDMELGVDGMPEKNVVKLASYLISLIKGHPPNELPTNICLTNTMTKQQVVQVFKQSIGKTNIDDIFIGLPQAEERQEILDYVDLFFASTMFEQNSYREFTELSQIVGADDLYGKLIYVLTCPSLKLKKTVFGPNSSADGTYDPYWNILKYEVNDSSRQSERIAVAKTLVHELLHAYVDLISGKKLSILQDEAMAFALQLGYFSMTGIYTNLYNIENLMNNVDMDNVERLETAVNMWNTFVKNGGNINGGTPLIETTMSVIDVEYKRFRWEQKSLFTKTTKEDFRRLQEITGFGLSNARLKQVAEYFNAKYCTDRFTVQSNAISY